MATSALLLLHSQHHRPSTQTRWTVVSLALHPCLLCFPFSSPWLVVTPQRRLLRQSVDSVQCAASVRARVLLVLQLGGAVRRVRDTRPLCVVNCRRTCAAAPFAPAEVKKHTTECNQQSVPQTSTSTRLIYTVCLRTTLGHGHEFVELVLTHWTAYTIARSVRMYN